MSAKPIQASVGDILTNRYGLKIKVVSIEERGLVIVYWDGTENRFAHKILKEWSELTDYKKTGGQP